MRRARSSIVMPKNDWNYVWKFKRLTIDVKSPLVFEKMNQKVSHQPKKELLMPVPSKGHCVIDPRLPFY